MFPITSFHPMSMGFPFAGQQQQQQQPPPSIYQSQYGGFQQQIPTAFTQAPPPPVQPYSQPGGPYISGPTPLSPRRNQYPPPPPAPSQHYEYRRNHRSKSKSESASRWSTLFARLGHQKQHKRRSVSPRGAAEQSLYSDRERAETVEKQEDRSASQSPALVNSDSKSEEGEGADHPHVENVSDEVGQGDAASAEEGKKIEGDHKRKSKSKKKKHQRAEHERYLSPPNQRGAFYNGGRNGFSSPSKVTDQPREVLRETNNIASFPFSESVSLCLRSADQWCPAHPSTQRSISISVWAAISLPWATIQCCSPTVQSLSILRWRSTKLLRTTSRTWQPIQHSSTLGSARRSQRSCWTGDSTFT